MLLVLMFVTPRYGSAQQAPAYNWSKIIKIDIDRNKFPRKYKAIEFVLNHMAADDAGQKIFGRIAESNDGLVAIRDKEELVTTSASQGSESMFSSDYGVQVIRRDMTYDPIANDLVINFTKSGEIVSFDEDSHQFFKVSLNSIIATELERAGFERTKAERNCRRLIAKMNEQENYLFNNYKDLYGEKFSSDDVEHCRGRKVVIYSLKDRANETYTFTDVVTDALREYRDYAEAWKKNSYAIETRETPLARKYTDKLGEPHRSKEPVFTLRLGENRYRSLQFGGGTGTDFIILGAGQQNVYKNLSVFYDDKNKETLDNPTVLTRIKEEYVAQLKYDAKARNSRKMLEYTDRLKQNCNKDYKAANDYQGIMDREVDQVTKDNPYIEGANEVILAETIWMQGKKKR